MVIVDWDETCPECQKEEALQCTEDLTRGETEFACRACGYGNMLLQTVRCIDCGKILDDQYDGMERVPFALMYHEATGRFDDRFHHYRGYGLPIMKCPNCNSFRLVTELLWKDEVPRFIGIPTSALSPTSELTGRTNDEVGGQDT